MGNDRTVAESHFMDWLRDAHAMEKQAETMLNALASRIENYPELKQRIVQHIDETREQARLLAECIKRRGGDTSLLKDFTGKVVATAQGFSAIFASDEVVKGTMFSYAFEHLEIAAYLNLIEAARVVEDGQTMQVCVRILEQEKAMAAWLEQNLTPIARLYLERAGHPEETAKR